jgi:hypothetical protein
VAETCGPAGAEASGGRRRCAAVRFSSGQNVAPVSRNTPHRRLQQQNRDHRRARPRLGQAAAAAAHGDGSARLVGAAVSAAPVATSAGSSPWDLSRDRRRLEGVGAVGGLGRRWRRACRGVVVRPRHGWLMEEEVFLDAEMRGGKEAGDARGKGSRR